MKNYSTLNSNIKRGIIGFSEKLCKGLSRPEFKFITQMIYGLLSAQSCHISEISRSYFKKSNIRAFVRGYDANIYYEHLEGLTDMLDCATIL